MDTLKNLSIQQKLATAYGVLNFFPQPSVKKFLTNPTFGGRGSKTKLSSDFHKLSATPESPEIFKIKIEI